MRVREVLGHRVAFDQIQAQAAVPGDQLGRNRRRAAAGQQGLVQPQALEHLAADDFPQNRDAEQQVELLRRHFGEDALLELEPQARHRNEGGRPGAVQILDEGVQRFGEIHMCVAVHHRFAFHPGAFEDVGQRQVGHHAVFGQISHAGLDVCHDPLGGTGDALETVHYALGLPGRARGVDQHGEVVRGADRAATQRRSARDDRVPGIEVGARGQRQGHAGQALGDAGDLLVPGVEFSHEQQAGAAVLQHEPHGFSGFGRENGDGGVAGHPDRQFGHEEVGAVFGKDRNTRSGFEPPALQVGGHAPGLVQRLGPGVVGNFGATEWLCQVDLVRLGGFKVVNVIEDEFVLGHQASLFLGAPAGATQPTVRHNRRAVIRNYPEVVTPGAQ